MRINVYAEELTTETELDSVRDRIERAAAASVVPVVECDCPGPPTAVRHDEGCIVGLLDHLTWLHDQTRQAR